MNIAYSSTKLSKLNNRGLTHIVAPLMIVLLVATVGTFMLVGSHAATAPRSGCASGKTLVNATPDDFVRGNFKSAARSGHGLICVKDASHHEAVSGPNAHTIVNFYKCDSGSVFAYDKTNSDGTGWNGGNKWILKSDNTLRATNQNGPSAPQNTTWYCIGNQHIGHDIETNSKGVPGIYNLAGLGHTYHFVPYPEYGKGYDKYNRCYDDYSTDLKQAICQTQYWFTYNGSSDHSRGTHSQ